MNFSRKIPLCFDDVDLNRNWLEPNITDVFQMLNCLHLLKWAFARPPKLFKTKHQVKYSSVILDLFDCASNYLSQILQQRIQKRSPLESPVKLIYYVSLQNGFEIPLLNPSTLYFQVWNTLFSSNLMICTKGAAITVAGKASTSEPHRRLSAAESFGYTFLKPSALCFQVLM